MENLEQYTNISNDIDRLYELTLSLEMEHQSLSEERLNLLFSLGVFYGDVKKDPEKAYYCFLHLSQIETRNHVIWCNLGSSLGQLGRHEDAIKALVKALEIEDDHLETWLNLGGAYMMLGKYEEAIEAFKQTTKIENNNVDT
jgi:tetratricopeptide (TPR) repeat protein